MGFLTWRYLAWTIAVSIGMCQQEYGIESVAYEFHNKLIASEENVDIDLIKIICPARCHCRRDSDQRLVVDCTNYCHKHILGSVPEDIPKETAILDLKNCGISVLKQNDFIGLMKLQTLVLANNTIQKLPELVFKDLVKLQYLDLSVNALGTHHISNGTFGHLSSLTYLNLARNHFTSMDPQVFVGLNQLRGLRLANNSLGHFPDFMLMGRNVLPRLTDLDVMRTGIRSFDLANMSTLQVLNVSYNNLKKLKENQFANGVNLIRLYMLQCGITHLRTDTFRGLSHLKQLSLSHNRLTRLGKNLFEPLISLEKLYLTNSSLTEFNVYCYNILPRLDSLFLQSNCISRFPVFKTSKGNQSSVPFLSVLNLDINAIENLPVSIFPLSNLTELILSRNRLRKLGPNALKAFPNLKKIQLSYNPALSEINFTSFQSNTLQTIDIAETGTKHNFKDLFSYTPNLSCLNISYSSVYYSSALTNLPNLRILVAKKIGLVDVRLFNISNTTNIEELDISNNYIKDVNREFFERLGKMKKLSLNNNAISGLNDTSLPKRYWTELTSIDISNNPFYCACDLLWFRKWINKKTNVTVLKIENKMAYKCVAPTIYKGTSLLGLKEPTDSDCFMSPQVSWELWIITLFVITFNVVSLLAAGLHRYRWHVRYWQHIVMTRRRRQQEFESSLSLPYDAFIAYSQSDTTWVIKHLVPRLTTPLSENQPSLKLCIHHRDWLAGRDIVDNIVDSIQSSRKTVLVVSNAFTRSDWCHVELTLAQSRLFQDERDSLVIILLEALDYSHVNPRLRYEMDRRTYIEWPEDSEVGQELFWLKLRQALERPQPEWAR